MIIKQVLDGLSAYEQKKIDKSGKSDAGAASKSGAGASGGDKVKLSEDGVLRSQATQTAMADEGVRKERIAELKALVAKGEYQPDNFKIAEKIVRDDLDFLL